jgi:fatty-acyl-CoA synthase
MVRIVLFSVVTTLLTTHLQGTSGHMPPSVLARSAEDQFAKSQKQGRILYGVEMKIQDDGGRDLPRDGKAFGNLLVRGPWIASTLSICLSLSLFTFVSMGVCLVAGCCVIVADGWW